MSTHILELPPGAQRIVITGTGAMSAFGNSVGEIRKALNNVRPEPNKARIIDQGESGLSRSVKTPDLKTDIQPQLANSMGKHLSLLLMPAEEAYRNSDLSGSGLTPEEIGFFAGMGMVDYRIEDLLPAVMKSASAEGLDYEKFYGDGYREIYPLWPLAMLNNVAFCQAAIHLGLRGENCVFSPHSDSGIQAVAEAVRALAEGKVKAALAGGVSEEVSALSVARARLNGLAPDFLGECGAMLVCEPLELALRRGARPVTAIAGFGFSHEKNSLRSSPSKEAVISAIRSALADARMGAGDIDLLFFSAAGNDEVDACEEASRELFRGADPLEFFTGREFGELFAAGPILNTILAAGIFELAQVPAGLVHPDSRSGAVNPDPGRNYHRALIVATSYEGSCASLVIEKISE